LRGSANAKNARFHCASRQASEVASIVAFLASDEASYVSGSAYTVDGCRTAA
jgi:NAD(P)-dependent dehydrogenase (short-subunit alcohol dehydrogenase family)